MPDRPTDNPGPPSGGDPEKTLHDLLAALSNVGDDAIAAGGEPPAGAPTSPEPTPLQELRTALDRLFDLIRTERAEQRAEIADLEAALATANARIRQLEAGERLEAPAPPPNDFNQLREAAERLRQRTQELFRDAGAVTALPNAPESDDEVAVEAVDESPSPAAPEPPEPDAPTSEDDETAGQEAEIASIEAFTKPTVLRVFPPPAGPEDDPELTIESELTVEQDIVAPPEEPVDDEADVAVAVAAELPNAAELPVEDELPDRPADAEPSPAAAEPSPATADAKTAATDATPAAPAIDRTEPIEIAPRPARKRRGGLRRRRIDARKLASVDPATALRAMVTAVDDIWTANVTLDLAIALTDGGTLKVTGGHNRPLNVGWVEPGTPARTTVTATTAQLVPLFGRLELTADQSAPLIHGPRRDADLLVGWIDRAQRLSPEPL